ncbi:alpha-glucan family phosphorylase [Nguyenibacter vanlangensis]|uniref:glycogen phosphorylase n=1 Tax=Nguyenibacter vanlangensis TaxID=1216886 RepID=A0A7Y7M5L9_9PROT|nr:alpha-glucan family phosphorylase [Nguyenibacter vanlangensis]NVN11167.1 alpha-glucan family phosphorylase [Nguyenibacter vanlangensis]
MGPLERFVGSASIAYFSMEIALDPAIPTYSGGLGILAGDAARSAADLDLPMVFVTLACRQGYLHQEIDARGVQHDHPEPWDLSAVARPLSAMVAVFIEGRAVWIRPWLHVLKRAGGAIPVLLLDTHLTENDRRDRDVADRLYGGNEAHRLAQEIVLGIGGEKVLRALGFSIATYHLNEGHGALLPLALLRQHPRPPSHVSTDMFPYDRERVLERCVFTTHTPVEAGHDRFGYELVSRILGRYIDLPVLQQLAGADSLNMTQLAVNLCGYINGVAERHGETTQKLFPGYVIRSITNGVHPETWVHPAFARLYDRICPRWRHEPEFLAYADILPPTDWFAAHETAKSDLLAAIRRATGRTLDPSVLIVGCARRMTAYKRADLILENLPRLMELAGEYPIQIVFAGKAHPRDGDGKRMIARIADAARRATGRVPIVFLPDYGFAQAKMLVAGADLWLNTPLPPMEASGTSGMKAALNGVPSLSVLDGWWIEGCMEGVTGWAIGTPDMPAEAHGAALLDKLQQVILPLFYKDRSGWARVMAGAVSKCGSVFTSHRMMRRYMSEAYRGHLVWRPR